MLIRRHTGVAQRGFLAARLAAVITLAVAATLFMAYEFGQIRAGHNRLLARERQAALQEELEQTESEKQRLRERIVILETNEKVKAEAYRQVEAQLTELQSTIHQQRENLAFYESIVSADPKSGLHIQDFDVSPRDGNESYMLRMVLAQAIRNNRKISGHLELSVDGIRDGKAVTLALSDIAANQGVGDRIDFSFRYFQNLKTPLAFPEGFAPDRVTVKLKPTGKGLKPVEQSFDWPARG